jgi:hypothetical protein
VSNLETGELTLEDIQLQHNEYPKLLDIIEINLEKKCFHHCYQEENYLLGKTSWSKKGAFPAANILDLCDAVDCLWLNGYHSQSGFNDRIPLKIAEEKITSSLLFIKPDNFSVVVEEDVRLLKRIRAKFAFKGVKYKLAVTDPLVENSYLKKPIGKHPVNSENVYLTVSLGEPYEGYCYKLVAGLLHLM